MSWTFRIMSPDEATPVSESQRESLRRGPDFEEHVPRTPLRSFREIVNWIVERAPNSGLRNADTIVLAIGPDGGCSLHLITVRWNDIATEAHRQNRDLHEAMSSYAPRDDEPVVEINVQCRGCGDTNLIAQCAAWLGAAVMDCSSGDFITPERWVRGYA